jgi:hypothetical protein
MEKFHGPGVTQFMEYQRAHHDQGELPADQEREEGEEQKGQQKLVRGNHAEETGTALCLVVFHDYSPFADVKELDPG